MHLVDSACKLPTAMLASEEGEKEGGKGGRKRREEKEGSKVESRRS